MFVLEMHRAYDFYVTSNVSDGVVPIFSTQPSVKKTVQIKEWVPYAIRENLISRK